MAGLAEQRATWADLEAPPSKSATRLAKAATARWGRGVAWVERTPPMSSPRTCSGSRGKGPELRGFVDDDVTRAEPFGELEIPCELWH